MKKLMIAASAALCAAVSMAVESANVVGYNTVTLKAQKMAMIGVPFEGVGTAGGISVQDLVATNGLTAAAAVANADQLWYYDPNEAGGYIKLYLYDSTLTSSAALQRKGKWLCAAKPTDTSWGTAGNAVSTKILTPGMGLWLVRKDASTPLTLTFAGSVVVSEAGTKDIAIREGMNMIAGSFTTDFALNNVASGASETDVDWLKKGCVGAAAIANADQIWFYDADESGGYVKTFLYDSTLTSSAAVQRKNHWLTGAKPTDTTWGTAGNAITPKKIPAGRGFWYIRKSGAGAFTLTLDQPYTL